MADEITYETRLRALRKLKVLDTEAKMARKDRAALAVRVKKLEDEGGGGGGGGGVSKEYVDESVSGVREYVDNLVNYSAITGTLTLSGTVPASSGGKLEKGQSLTQATLSWSFSKDPAEGTASLTDHGAISAKTGSTTLAYDPPVTTGKTWTLTGKETPVPGKSQAQVTKSVSVQFLNGVYYGKAAAPASVDSAFILGSGFTKTLSASRVASFSVNAAAGEYIWYALPESIGACAFKVGGFDGGFTLVDTILFTNASGFSENYRVYRSDNAGLGSTTVSVLSSEA